LGLSPKHKLILRLYACGLPVGEVASRAGRSETLVRRVVGREDAKEYLLSLESELDQQFKGLFEKVIKVVEKGLDSPELGVALASANLYLKAHGKYVHKVHTRDLTAEDIIKKIISGELRREAPSVPIQEIPGVIVSDGGDMEAEEEEDKPMRMLNG